MNFNVKNLFFLNGGAHGPHKKSNQLGIVIVGNFSVYYFEPSTH
jgi:hypothetical protein